MNQVMVKMKRFSEKKRERKGGEEKVVSPPFPLSFRPENGAKEEDDIVWPLVEPVAQLFVQGMVSETETCVLISDGPSIEALALLGYFGSRDEVHAVRQVVTELPIIRGVGSDSRRGRPSGRRRRGRRGGWGGPEEAESKQRAEERRLDEMKAKKELQMASLVRAFVFIPRKESLINGLYTATDSCLEQPQVFEPTISGTSRDTYGNDGSCSSGSGSASGPRLKSQPNSHEAETVDESESRGWLRLTLVEAYFLAYGLGVLSVYSSEGKRKMNLIEMWSCFCRLFNEKDLLEFPALYGVYHYFRSKGWIVKSGLTFGSDLVLYKEGPPFYHSLISLTVIKQRKNELMKPSLSWSHLTGFLRLSQGVVKEPVLCWVIIPNELTDNDFKTPKVIERLSIQTISMQRWLPSASRGQKSE